MSTSPQYVPPPLSPHLLSRNDVGVRVPADAARSTLTGARRAYTGIDLDTWAATVLAHVQALVAPGVAEHARSLSPRLYERLTQAHESLVEAVSGASALAVGDRFLAHRRLAAPLPAGDEAAFDSEVEAFRQVLRADLRNWTARLTQIPGQAPVLRRPYPDAPILRSAQALPSAPRLRSAAARARLRAAMLWDYELNVSVRLAPEDDLLVSLEVNASALRGAAVPRARNDLFSALAAFLEEWPTLFHLFTSSARGEALLAGERLVALASTVAHHWAGWTGSPDPGYVTPAIHYRFWLEDDAVRVSSSVRGLALPRLDGRRAVRSRRGWSYRSTGTVTDFRMTWRGLHAARAWWVNAVAQVERNARVGVGRAFVSRTMLVQTADPTFPYLDVADPIVTDATTAGAALRQVFDGLPAGASVDGMVVLSMPTSYPGDLRTHLPILMFPRTAANGLHDTIAAAVQAWVLRRQPQLDGAELGMTLRLFPATGPTGDDGLRTDLPTAGVPHVTFRQITMPVHGPAWFAGAGGTAGV